MRRLKMYVLEMIQRYVEHKQKPSGFVMVLLTNDLHGAVSRADGDNRADLADIVEFMRAHVPAEAWGSPEKVAKWLKG